MDSEKLTNSFDAKKRTNYLIIFRTIFRISEFSRCNQKKKKTKKISHIIKDMARLIFHNNSTENLLTN